MAVLLAVHCIMWNFKRLKGLLLPRRTEVKVTVGLLMVHFINSQIINYPELLLKMRFTYIQKKKMSVALARPL